MASVFPSDKRLETLTLIHGGGSRDGTRRLRAQPEGSPDFANRGRVPRDAWTFADARAGGAPRGIEPNEADRIMRHLETADVRTRMSSCAYLMRAETRVFFRFATAA